VNVLVTGAAGYIGSVCAEVLLARGMSVLALDDLREGHRAAVPPAATFVQLNLGDERAVNDLFASHPIDAVMHFAGEALVAKSVREPSAFYLANVAYGTILLDAMTRHHINNLIFSSTCAVYGEPSIVPIPEDHPKAPINPYGKSKLTFESVLADYRSYTGLRYVALRYFNAAGASIDRGEAHRTETHLIPKVLDAAQGMAPHVEIFGTDYATPDGTCVRDYVHVLDIADSHVRALEAIDRVAGQSFNVGNGPGYSILQVIETARRITGQPISHKFSDRRPGDPATLIATGEKIRRELAWQPQHSSLDEIISSAWAWRQQHPRGYEKHAAV
jgi:UDP-glucose 4-epimerase